ncbi:MAG: cupin [Rhodospirillales bacterium 69-11]|jgi:quercetin dioxygenase-like cupin family protein|nr:cupin domain-containing protein [Rhodospirillales bacterium]MBN8908458.1 cupin domain-containing protein [Rhodospirillales bacterium]MBN8925419.1 cupin domain-containing protein [Rhodospirillales bacterium]OJW26602.1 MAG: cupin [Rhodospirillales bacterium 69-11]
MSTLRVIRAGARPTKRAPAANFTGTVFSDEVVTGSTPSRMRASVVSFTPGARTFWHSHPVGQTLYCLSGAGRVQKEGEPVQELRPGDVVVIPPDVRHWHGAAPDRLFAHLAMSELNDRGEGTAWFEPVSDADYAARPAPVG